MPRRPSKAGPRVWLDRFDQVKALQDAGRNLNAIIEQTGLNWRTVAKWLEADALPERPPRDPKSTNPVKFESFLAQRWNAGIRTAQRLLTEIRQLGYAGSLSHLQRLLSQWRGSGSTVLVQKPRVNHTLIVPAPRIVPPIAASILRIKPRGQLSRQEEMTVDVLKRTSPGFAAMRQLAMRFRGSDRSNLAGWMDDAHRTGLYRLRRFVLFLRRDVEAVRNAISERWSNGQTEGQINRLKTLKRSMYGRAGVELLRARRLPLAQ